ncbi:MAG: glycosyltransferase family 4 protein [Mariniblastus sp.]
MKPPKPEPNVDESLDSNSPEKDLSDYKPLDFQPDSSPTPSHTEHPKTLEAKGLNVAIVARRFWPLAGSTEFAVGDLADALNSKGHHVNILTIRWERNWPSDFHYRESPVRRINRPVSGPWGSYRYLRNLNQTLGEYPLDGIVVFGLDEEAWSIAKAYGGKIPFVIRIDNHLLGDKSGQPSLNSRQITSLAAADKILCESRWTAERLLNHPSVASTSIASKISVCPDPIHISVNHQRSPARQGSARIAVSDAHPILMIEPTQPLVICGAPMNGDNGLNDLVNSWTRVLKRHPKARLWIIGEGKKSRKVWDRINDKHLVNSVIMPGSFDDLDDVFQAADLYVHPLRSDESCSILARAMTAGVCSIVTDTRATRDLIQPSTDGNDFINGIVVKPGDNAALTEAMLLALGNKDMRDRLGRAAARSTANTYDASTVLHDFIDTFVSLNE